MTVRVIETVREEGENWYVKNIIEIKIHKVLITDWMVRVD